MKTRDIKRMARQFISREVNNPVMFTSKGKIRKTLKANDETIYWNVEDCYNERLIASFYLGTLINPSGKYYLPFACSNVEKCPKCHGTGHTKKLYDCPYCTHGKRYIEDIRRSGYIMLMIDIIEGKYPIKSDVMGDFIDCIFCQGTGKHTHDCNYCGGMGSREAYEDDLFWEFLDDYASKHEGYIESGEGDPCDTFLCFVVKEASNDSQD